MISHNNSINSNIINSIVWNMYSLWWSMSYLIKLSSCGGGPNNNVWLFLQIDSLIQSHCGTKCDNVKRSCTWAILIVIVYSIQMYKYIYICVFIFYFHVYIFTMEYFVELYHATFNYILLHYSTLYYIWYQIILCYVVVCFAIFYFYFTLLYFTRLCFIILYFTMFF